MWEESIRFKLPIIGHGFGPGGSFCLPWLAANFERNMRAAAEAHANVRWTEVFSIAGFEKY